MPRSCSSQGFGGGGITLLIETVVTDLVPLRERGKYMAITLLGSILGTAGGPFIGGVIVEHTTWRWIFYLNLPIASCKLIIQILPAFSLDCLLTATAYSSICSAIHVSSCQLSTRPNLETAVSENRYYWKRHIQRHHHLRPARSNLGWHNIRLE